MGYDDGFFVKNRFSGWFSIEMVGFWMIFDEKWFYNVFLIKKSFLDGLWIKKSVLRMVFDKNGFYNGFLVKKIVF